jgi:hypothetical protein
MRKSSIVVLFLLLLLGCNESPQFTLQEIGVKRLGLAKPKIICYSAPDSCFFLITEDYTLAKLDLNLEVLQTKTLPPDQYKAIFPMKDGFMLCRKIPFISSIKRRWILPKKLMCRNISQSFRLLWY